MKPMLAKLMLETLEGRDCPSVTFRLQDGGQTLVIKGDASADTVHIAQDDVNDRLTLTRYIVPSNPRREPKPVVENFTSSKISRIVVDMGAGNDSLNYELVPGSTFKYGKTFQVNLGEGDDLAQFIVDDASMSLHQGAINGLVALEAQDEAKMYDDVESVSGSIQSHFKLNVTAGAGNDQVKVDLGDMTNGGAAVISANLGEGDDVFCATMNAIGAGSKVRLSADGGAGADTLYTALHGQVDAQSSANVFLRGQNGDDDVTVDQIGAVLGILNAHVWGGAGDDQLQATLNTLPNTPAVNLFMQGEAGDDVINVNLPAIDADSGNAAAASLATGQKPRVLLNGGDGFDRATLSINLPTQAIEVVHVLTNNDQTAKL